MVPVDGSGQPEPLLVNDRVMEGKLGATVSPDGRWLAYHSTITETNEVWVKAFPDGAPVRVSEGGKFPVWSRDGTELYYRNEDKMMVVRGIGSGAEFTFERRDELFTGDYWAEDQSPSYDVAEDGRFVMIRVETAQQNSRSVNVIVNWFEELKQRVPTGGG